MAGFILHVGATVQCAHGGTATPLTPNTRVTVNNQPVVCMDSQYSVAGCSYPPPPTASGPCLTGQFMTSSTRVTAGGTPVLLLDSQATCMPTGTPLMIVSTQTKVTAQ